MEKEILFRSTLYEWIYPTTRRRQQRKKCYIRKRCVKKAPLNSDEYYGANCNNETDINRNEYVIKKQAFLSSIQKEP